MSPNVPGIFAAFQALLHPRLIVPSMAVCDIRQLDFAALQEAGYRAAVFDKDNCLTVPDSDTLIPQLQEAWNECRQVFGDGNVLVVSNSAGSRTDAGELRAESVSYHLQVPVLRHNIQKPGYSCIKDIRTYFLSLPRPVHDEELVIIGDRVFTDIVLANRMASQVKAGLFGAALTRERRKPINAIRCPDGPLAVLTTGIWQRETILGRTMEKAAVNGVERWVLSSQDVLRRRELMHRFVRPLSSTPHPDSCNSLAAWWNRIQ